MIIRPAKRTESVQEYYFSRKLKEIGRMNAARDAAGEERIINLGIGAPDGMPPAEAIAALVESAERKDSHAYQSYVGLPALRKAFADWYGRYYHAELDPACEIQPLVGSKEGILLISLAFLDKGDKVLVHSPTYIGFTGCLKNNGYSIIHSPLVLDDDGVWRMDFEDMEQKIVKEKIHAAIFCSPHNPCGRVWERWEIEKAMALFQKHDVMVVSDEIWSDIIRPGFQHIPTQSVSEDARMRTVALYAPSKTFNLAGLVGSYHIIYNKTLRERIDKESSLSHYNSMNVLWMHALIGGYNAEGEEWVDQLRQVIAGNVDYACDYIAAHFDGVRVVKPQGTYMLFIDCTEWCAKHGKTIDWVEKAGWDVGVAWQDGRMFHGPCHIRMNLALPLSRVKEAFDRLDRYVFNA